MSADPVTARGGPPPVGPARDATELLAGFVADAAAHDPVLRGRARVFLADAIVLALAAGSVTDLPQVLELGAGTGEHLAWASGRRLGAADAVHANAVAVHARFQDDTDMSSWSHPGSFVVPAAAAAAVEAGAPLSRLLDALVVGYAATSWLGGEGAVAKAMKPRGWRPSPAFAPLGAAAGASRALGLPAQATRHALDAAALQGRGTLHSVGAGGDDWRLHNPGGARDGFTCALAAGRGLRAAPGALTGRHGFLAVVTGSSEQPGAWSTAPDPGLALGVWQKRLPVLGDVVAAALAARSLHAELDDRGELAALVSGRSVVEVHMNAEYAAFPGTQTLPPYRSSTAAQASVRWCTAQLLLHGTLTTEDLQARDDPRVDELAERLSVIARHDLAHTDARVEVTGADGSVRRRRTADLPTTLFWRDVPAQREVAGELLGARGEDLVDAIESADDNRPVTALLEEWLGA